MEEFFKLLASFLGGSIFTTIVFIFTFYARISSMQTTLLALVKSFDDHIKAKPQVCPLHSGIEADCAVLKAAVEYLKEDTRK